jgi:PHD/YefM family antitoxin component YafN of YafNO toxin-antitoxin module
LKKPDPPTTRSLTVLTLTRLFMLTWEHTNLIREITTPSLPGFVSTCLSNIESKRCSPDELQTILDAFAVLIVRHSTIFRPNESALRAILLKILGSAPSGSDNHFHYTAGHKEAARRLLVLLHHCTPKQGSSEKWSETLKNVLSSAHATCDYLFRGIEHDWESTSGVQPFRPKHQLMNGEAELPEQDALGMSAWSGIYAGHERLVETLRILSIILMLPTPAAVPVKLGSIMDLLSRILSIGTSDLEKIGSIKFSSQIVREEREAVLAILPAVRVAAFEVVNVLLARFQTTTMSILPILTQLVSNLFQADRNEDVRGHVYKTLAAIVALSGATFTRADTSLLNPALRSCCQQLLPSDSPVDEQEPQTNGTAQATATKVQAKQTSSSKTTSSVPSDSSSIFARLLLLSALQHLPSSTIPTKVRSQIDRVAVLTKDKDLLVASVLNPSQREHEIRAQASLMPILARLAPRATEVETLIRPRMPVVRMRRGVGSGIIDKEDEYENEEEEEEEQIQEDDAYMVDDDAGEPSKSTEPQSQTELQSSSTSQKRPLSPLPTELDLSLTATQPTTKRTRLSPSPEENSLLNDLEAQLQSDMTNSNSKIDQDVAEVVEEDRIVETASGVASATASGFGSGGTSSGNFGGNAGSDDDEMDEMDGSDFEMPPLTMEVDSDSEEEEEE